MGKLRHRVPRPGHQEAGPLLYPSTPCGLLRASGAVGGGGFCQPQSLCLVLTGGEGLTAHGDSKGLALSLSGGRKHAARGLGLAPPRKKPGLVARALSVNQG